MKFKKLIVSGILASISFFLSSCTDAFNVPVREFFVEYTETAAIVKMELTKSYPNNAAGITCFPSDSDNSMLFHFRNPQKYMLECIYHFNDAGAAQAAASIPMVYVQSADKSTATYTFPKELLYKIDCDNIKNISGYVELIESNTRRIFEPYYVTLHANSFPPEVKSPCFQLTDAGSGSYILCFYLPDVSAMEVHEKDTHLIQFNGRQWYFDGAKIYRSAERDATGSWTYNDEDTDFVYSKPTMYPLMDGGYEFIPDTSVPNYKAVYYYTGIPYTSDTVTMDISIVDDEGLTSSISISNKAEQLTAPFVADIDELAAGVPVDEKTGLCGILLCHDGQTTGGSSVGGISIEYQIYKASDSSLVDSGIVASNTKITLPAGKYNVTAKATKPYYITSDVYDSTETGLAPDGIWLKPSVVFYVSETGSNDNNGAYNTPYRTIQKAVEKFTDGLSDGTFEATDICTIRLLSDLTPSDDDVFAFSDPYLVIFTDYSYVIEGYNGTKRTIDVQGTAETGNRGIFEIYRGANVTLKNLILTGGYTDHNASVIYQAGYSDIVLENVDITGNTNNNAVDANSTLYFASGDVKYKSGKVYGNTTGTGPSAFYIKGILELGSETGLVEIYDNTSNDGDTPSACKLGTSSDSELKIKKAKIYNNTDKDGNQANVYIPTGKKITVTGNLTGCKIGVKTEASPSFGSPVVFTAGFGANNAAAPGTVFVSDDSRYGVKVAGGEGALSVSGGTISDVITSQSVTFACAKYEAVSGVSAIRFYPGNEKEITITPTLTINETDQDDDSEFWDVFAWKTWLTDDGETVAGSTKTGTGKTIEALIPTAAIYDENYYLHVKATINGVSYDGDWLCKPIKDISYMDSAPISAGTYCVGSAAGLKKLKGWVNAGSASRAGIVYEMTSDINASSDSEIGNIGTSTYPFRGTFDGKGYKISNISITSSDEKIGLFAYISGATIQNLTVTGTVSSSSSKTLGGIVGQATSSTIKNCVNYATVTNSNPSTTGDNVAGGIAGFCVNQSGSIIDGCVNYGDVTSPKFAAGIIASGGVGTTIRNCINKGAIECTNAGGAGGIEPQQYAAIYNCINNGNVTVSGSGNSGGIVATGGGSYELSNCFSSAIISNPSLTAAGNISGNATKKAASKNNYFAVPGGSSVVEGIGGTTPKTELPYTCKCTVSGGTATAVSDSSITAGIYTGKDVVELLNAWIDSQANPGLYRRWKYDSGKPVFED